MQMNNRQTVEDLRLELRRLAIASNNIRITIPRLEAKENQYGRDRVQLPSQGPPAEEPPLAVP